MPRTVLLVDDDVHVRRALGSALEAAGYTVLFAEDGGRALALLRGSEPLDLVLLDLMMPGKSGWETFAERDADATVRRIPIVVMTGFELPLEVPAHAAGVLRKPFGAEELVHEVGRVLGTLPAARQGR